MGGSSSSSSSQTQSTDNSRKVEIDDDRAAVSDNAVAITGDTGGGSISISDLSPQVAAELRKAGEAGFNLSEAVLKAGFDFANEANKSVGSLSNTLAGIASEATDEDAKEFLTTFVKWSLMAGVAVAGLAFYARRK